MNKYLRRTLLTTAAMLTLGTGTAWAQPTPTTTTPAPATAPATPLAPTTTPAPAYNNGDANYRLPLPPEDCEVRVTPAAPGFLEDITELPIVPDVTPEVGLPDAVCSLKDPERIGPTFIWGMTVFTAEASILALEFLTDNNLGNAMIGPVADMNARAATIFIGPFDILTLAIGFAVLLAGFRFLAGNTSGATRELFTTLIGAAISITFLVNPAGYFETTSKATHELSVGLLQLGTNDPADTLHDNILRGSWELVGFGGPQEGACDTAATQILTDPNIDPVATLQDAGCDAAAAHIANPSAGQMGVSSASLLLSTFTLINILVLGAGLAIGQILLGAIFAISHFAVVLLPMPFLRTVTFTWGHKVAKTIARMVASAAVLAFTLEAVNVTMAVSPFPELNMIITTAVLIAVLFLGNNVRSGATKAGAATVNTAARAANVAPSMPAPDTSRSIASHATRAATYAAVGYASGGASAAAGWLKQGGTPAPKPPQATSHPNQTGGGGTALLQRPNNDNPNPPPPGPTTPAAPNTRTDRTARTVVTPPAPDDSTPGAWEAGPAPTPPILHHPHVSIDGEILPAELEAGPQDRGLPAPERHITPPTTETPTPTGPVSPLSKTTPSTPTPAPTPQAPHAQATPTPAPTPTPQPTPTVDDRLEAARAQRSQRLNTTPPPTPAPATEAIKVPASEVEILRSPPASKRPTDNGDIQW